MMNTIERRRLSRERTMIGTYQLNGHEDQGWFECRVLDYSPAGVGLELFGPQPQHQGEQLVIRLELSGRLEGGGVQLPGVVSNSTLGSSGYPRVGVELHGLGADKYSSLAGRRVTTHSRWPAEQISRSGDRTAWRQRARAPIPTVRGCDKLARCQRSPVTVSA